MGKKVPLGPELRFKVKALNSKLQIFYIYFGRTLTWTLKLIRKCESLVPIIRAVGGSDNKTDTKRRRIGATVPVNALYEYLHSVLFTTHVTAAQLETQLALMLLQRAGVNNHLPG